MPASRDFHDYASKMRDHVLSGTDLEVDVRFIDMIADRRSRILDIGCGVGNAVNGLRTRNHDAYGIDPSPDVLQVAADLFDRSWFRLMSATDITAENLADEGLPQSYDLILMSGNVPAFLTDVEDAFSRAAEVLRPGGFVVIGTTTHAKGGPSDQDAACEATAAQFRPHTLPTGRGLADHARRHSRVQAAVGRILRPLPRPRCTRTGLRRTESLLRGMRRSCSGCRLMPKY